jgi:hypothetical protein
MLKDPGRVTALHAAPVPVRRWHRWQWQYTATTSGSVTSKRMPPQLQPPVSGSSGT